jgi:hypothetical protein
MSSIYSVLEGNSALLEVTNMLLLLSRDSKSCLGFSGQGMISTAPK